MRILIFIILVSLIGGLILTLSAKPIKKTRDTVVNRINRSFEDEKETGKDDSKSF